MNVLRLLSVVALVSVFTVSCGGGSKSDDPVALCKQGCSKGADLCASGLGIDPAQIKALCESACTSNMGAGMTCTNTSAIIAAFKTCLNKTTCAEYTTCAEGVPECEGGSTGSGGSSGTGGAGTGTGGRSGTGGSSGGNTGGSSGGGGAGVAASCNAVLACCNASTNATIKAVCMAQYEGIKNAGEEVCAMALTQLKDGDVCP